LELAARAAPSRSAISTIEHGAIRAWRFFKKILLAAGFDLRTRLVPHDDDDHLLMVAAAA
jgi:hypothetical protein